jgi:hypothetical protein
MAGAFRRLTNPLLVPVVAGTVGSKLEVPPGFIPGAATSFYVSNSNLCHVRLMGTSGSGATFTAVEEGKGWCFGPSFASVFATQNPIWMSALAVAREGFPLTRDDGTPITLYPLEVSYGEGM